MHMHPNDLFYWTGTYSLSVCHDQKRKEEHQPAQIILKLISGAHGKWNKSENTLLVPYGGPRDSFPHSSADTRCK